MGLRTQVHLPVPQEFAKVQHQNLPFLLEAPPVLGLEARAGRAGEEGMAWHCPAPRCPVAGRAGPSECGLEAGVDALSLETRCNWQLPAVSAAWPSEEGQRDRKGEWWDAQECKGWLGNRLWWLASALGGTRSAEGEGATGGSAHAVTCWPLPGGCGGPKAA